MYVSDEKGPIRRRREAGVAGELGEEAAEVTTRKAEDIARLQEGSEIELQRRASSQTEHQTMVVLACSRQLCDKDR